MELTAILWRNGHRTWERVGSRGGLGAQAAKFSVSWACARTVLWPQSTSCRIAVADFP